MNRYKIKIEYDGTPFVGWQRQENGQSVQGCIEKAINNIFEENITIFGAGRTDAGVFTQWGRSPILMLQTNYLNHM